MRTLELPGFEIGSSTLTVIAGPCTAESFALCTDVATACADICRELGLNYVFKASFDKANRTSVGSDRGPGQEALEWIKEAGMAASVPTTTDVHLPSQAEMVAGYVDLLQIPAFLCRQSDLLEAAADTGKPVNVKKGQFLAPADAKNIVAKLDAFNAAGVMLTERGTTFGYNNLVVDMPGLETMRGFEVPVCFDATHSAQRPGAGGTSSGGSRESVPALVRAASAVGIDALFIEVHPDPANAVSDAATQWPLAQFRDLLREAIAIRRAVQAVWATSKAP
ncbi:MAG: 3-deoxy-8-phosphooctulonate synthase [Fimbriimonadaceae bacterium]